MSVNPIRIKGNWEEGYALDLHTISSIPVGENEFGHQQFDTTRSQIGELLFEFKYRNKYDKLKSIIALAKPFLDNWEALKEVDTVIAVPSSRQREYQPAEEIAKAVAEYLDLCFVDKVLEKITSEQSKNMDKNKKVLHGSIIAVKKAGKPHTILLIDDLYSSGETLMECVRVLKEDKNLKNIYVLTMTKTR